MQLARQQGMQESQTEKEEMRAAAEDEGRDRCDKENQAKRQSGCKQQLVGQCGAGRLLRKSVAPPRMGRHHYDGSTGAAQDGEDTLLQWYKWLFEMKMKDE